MACRLTQGQRLIAYCRAKPRTYMDLQMTGISTCAHKRLREAAEVYLKEGERLVEGADKQGRVTFRVVKG